MNTYRIVVADRHHKRQRHLLDGNSFSEVWLLALNTWGKACVESVTPIRIPRLPSQKARPA